MKIPDKIRIGASDYSIDEVVEVDEVGSLGSARRCDRKIKIKGVLPEEAKFGILWHEAIHMSLFNAGDSQHSEAIVEQLESAIVQLLRDNPYLRGEHLFEPPMIIVADMSAKELADMSAEDLTGVLVGSNNGDGEAPPPKLREAVVERLLDNSPEKSL